MHHSLISWLGRNSLHPCRQPNIVSWYAFPQFRFFCELPPREQTRLTPAHSSCNRSRAFAGKWIVGMRCSTRVRSRSQFRPYPVRLHDEDSRPRRSLRVVPSSMLWPVNEFRTLSRPPRRQQPPCSCQFVKFVSHPPGPLQEQPFFATYCGTLSCAFRRGGHGKGSGAGRPF